MEQPPVKRLNRELKYQGTILKIYEDTVEANGHEAHWDFIHHNGAAAVVPVTKEGKLLMVRQYRNALDRYTLEIPAGALDFPEEPKLDCAHRELEEETGYQAGIYRPLAKMYPTAAYDTEIIHIYYASDLTATQQRLDPNEFLTVQKIPVEKAVQMVLAGEIPDGKTQLGILKYKALSEQGLL